MANAPETVTTLNGMFKVRYADSGVDLVPEHSDFARLIKFESRTILGDSFQFPVRVRRAAGATYAAGGDAFDLNDAIAGKTVNVTVTPQSYVLRDQIAYDAAASAASSEAAFGDVVDEVVKDMQNAGSLHRDISILYGQSDLGTFANAGGANATESYSLTVATSAPGMILQLEGSAMDVYDSTLSTKRNSTGALTLGSISIGADDQVSFTLTGATADNDAVQAGDVLVPKGFVAGSMVGIDKICKNTGTLFGVNGATYGLWLANTYNVGGAALTMLDVTRAAATQVMRSGRKGKKLTLLVSYATWNNLNNNAVALRRFAESTKSKIDLGTENLISYHGPGVTIDVVPCGIIKNGEAFMGEWESVKRVGASDLTFNLPGSSPDSPKFFHQLEGKAAYELRMYWRQAIVPMRPACLTKFTGIVND